MARGFRGARQRGPMFFRLKKSGERGYVQIVENKRDGAAVRQRVIANVGRADELAASGALASLIASGAELHRSSVASTRSTRTPKARCRLRRSGSVGRCCSVGSGGGRRRRCPDPFAEGARVRVFGRARRVRRRAASAIRLGIGSRLLVVDGGLRHPRRRRARSASLLPRHGLARRGGRGEAGRALAPRSVKDLIEEKLFDRRRDLFTDLSIVFMDTTEPLLLRRGRRDARRARLLQGLSPRPEADDPRPRRRRRRAADLHRDVAGNTADVSRFAGGRPLAETLFHRPGLRRRPRHDLGRNHRRAGGAQARIYPRRTRALRRRRAQDRARERRSFRAPPRRAQGGRDATVRQEVKAEGVRYVVCRNEAEAENDRKDRESDRRHARCATEEGRQGVDRQYRVSALSAQSRGQRRSLIRDRCGQARRGGALRRISSCAPTRR